MKQALIVIILLVFNTCVFSQAYQSDSVSVFVEDSEEWVFIKTVPFCSGIIFAKNNTVSFYDKENDFSLHYSNTTDMGEALRFDFIDSGVWVVLIIQKDLSQYQTYIRNEDCTAIKRVYRIKKL